MPESASGRSQVFDVAVVGAGAAGMMCAAVAGQRGRRVVLVDHSARIGEKIRISGGGRCNFTNRGAAPEHFVSRNPHFCRSALAGYGASDFVALVRQHRIGFHEKHRGQLFCDESAGDIIEMLEAECANGRVSWRRETSVATVRRDGAHFRLETSAGPIVARALVVATGGLSIPKIGATDFGYRIARQFGHTIVEPLPGLVPLTFAAPQWKSFAELAGVSLTADIECAGPYGRAVFREDLLFTHRGLSGPAILQISNHWRAGATLAIDLTPDFDWNAWVADKAGRKALAATALADVLPRRLAATWTSQQLGADAGRPLADMPDRRLRDLAQSLSHWQLSPAGTEGFRKAEVTLGGVDTREMSSRTMESRIVPGLFFIGEVVDVTGWLGGYNFQWAWASAVACARAL
ncbi:MAG: NAD(P)/FAD-dependent oxidoreductase [Burkholderiales bacterium]